VLDEFEDLFVAAVEQARRNLLRFSAKAAGERGYGVAGGRTQQGPQAAAGILSQLNPRCS